MKFWQKAFMILLILFVITFNLSMVMILHFTYEEELASVERKASGEAYFIISSITKDLSNMSNFDRLDEGSLTDQLNEYLTYYEKQKVQLGFWKGDNQICSNLPGTDEVTPDRMQLKEGSQKLKIMKIADRKYMFVTSTLLEPYDGYKMIYGYALDDLTRSSRKLLYIASLVDGCITFLLAGILFWVLNRLTKPLKELAAFTDEVAKGEYSKKIGVSGHDEFALLGNKFNLMSSKIEEQIELLKLENEKKQLLIDNMAHEFRTPLTSISGYAEYIKVAPLNADQTVESLDYIINESKRLQKLSQIILRMADLREEKLEIGEIDVTELVERLGQVFDKQKRYPNVKLFFNTHGEKIQGNFVMIESLLINLIENAMRACQENGEVKVSFINHPSLKHTIIEVKDNGIGMEEVEISKISQPFYRIDKARSRKAGGVGLGVSLCQNIIKAHKGELHYDSKLGEGTKATVTLPLNSFTS